jgi:acetyl-CoA carboxylase biotin carboxylase subunit
MPPPFRKVLIANRGEIALRIIRACQELEIPTAAVYSEADRTALHVRHADEAYEIGPPPPSQSYLDMEKIVDVARRCKADALHPGYGFLSENAEFAERCRQTGITFIGPPPEAIRAMGDKIAAQDRMRKAGVPTVPATESPVKTLREARAAAEALGLPVMLKASGGGGGKGMRRIDDLQELETQLASVVSESRSAFGQSDVYIEKIIPRARHIEVQLFGDRHGNLVHMGERECSIQRRHQKLVEESPSPFVDEALRRALTETALLGARAIGYQNAGTMEFLVDEHKRFYFLEMNTRLQVEHAVTEMVTGIDLVKEQIRVAAGERLSRTQQEIRPRGHAIEVRICAEDPENRFLPSTGTVHAWAGPGGPNVRVDSSLYRRMEVGPHYDSLLAKLIVWANSRENALSRLGAALRETHILGISTTIPFFLQLLQRSDFRKGEMHTGLVESRSGEKSSNLSGEREAVSADRQAAIAAACLYHLHERRRTSPSSSTSSYTPSSLWRRTARVEGIDRRS